MKVSVLSYSFRRLLNEGTMDLFGYLETCRYRYGLQAADIWNGFLPTLEPGYLAKVRFALEEREMVLADLCVDKAHLWEDDSDLREQNRQNALAHLRAAEQLGCRFMRVDAGGRLAEWTDEQFDYIVAGYQEYAQFAWDHGFRMGSENHWGTERRWENTQKLYKAVDHPGFGLSCHIGNWEGTPEEVDTADRESAPWVCHTHIASNIIEGPLEGKLGNLHGAGYDGYYSVELWESEREYTRVGAMIASVRDVLAGWR
jgi:sugar phosphate isomerase/epimerase